ncbi:hypothetical protein Tco_0657384 [Tanacetum coccineum]|uniref:Integrase, catalytic region, zinc finger, CCHC-type, peptidase aspartic, catalytic n=1 Tax=Tanacetum coccineum TaxID=301880 RepID=A0ABQ4XC37_9ASTR
MDPMISLGQKNTLAEYMILSGADNRPPMLDKDLYDSWMSIMELYIQNQEHGRMILEPVEHGPLIWPTVEDNGVIRTKKYAELSAVEKIQADCDMQATNIILQSLPADIYSLVNHHRVAKDLWERVQLLMQGTSLTKQERECKMYDAFDKFTHIKGESLHTYYLRFTPLINDMNIYKMKMEQFQVNTKFLNSLPPEWSKFMTDIKLVKDLHTSNFDQLHAYLEQHEIHANEVRIMRERNQDPLAFIANLQMLGLKRLHGFLEVTTAQVLLDSGTTRLQGHLNFDSGFAVPMFSPGDDPIACLNKAMAFLTAVASSRSMECPADQAQTITPHNACFPTKDLDTFGIQTVMITRTGTSDNDKGETSTQRQIDSLEQNLSKQIKEKESLLQTLTVFKNESKEKENKYMENELGFGKEDKELDNIVYKVGQILLRRNEIVENVVYIPSATTIAPGMFKLDLVPLPPRLLQNREVHINYLRNTQEQANILRKIVEQAKAKQPLDRELELTCNAKKVTVKPVNNVKKVRFDEPLTSSSKIQQAESSNTSDSNTPVLSSKGVKCSTSNCGSKPLGNKNNDKISQTPSKNKKNKSLSNANSDILCATYKKSMFDGVHDKCLFDLVQNGNNSAKSAKKHKKQNIWKHTGHVFTEVGFKWKPTGRTFTIVGNLCPLTRITSTNVVPPKQTTSHSDEIQKLEIKVYRRKPKNVKNIGSSKIAKIVESKNANPSEPNQTWGSTAIDIPSYFSLVMTGCPDCTLIGNDQIANYRYGDYQLGNIIISRVYYVEGLGHNLFFVGQSCDADLEVAFRKNTCFIRNLEGVDLLSGSLDTNLYTISLDDMLKSSLICLLSKASKTKSWL